MRAGLSVKQNPEEGNIKGEVQAPLIPNYNLKLDSFIKCSAQKFNKRKNIYFKLTVAASNNEIVKI